jgi:hypothetical protein
MACHTHVAALRIEGPTLKPRFRLDFGAMVSPGCFKYLRQPGQATEARAYRGLGHVLERRLPCVNGALYQEQRSKVGIDNIPAAST